MTRRWLLGVALLATVAWTGSAMAWFHDYFPAGADGSFDTYPSEGYSAGADGNFRHTKADHHIVFLDFVSGKSDGQDHLRDGYTGDSGDGWLLPNWVAGNNPPTGYTFTGGKKVTSAVLYMRDATNDFCNSILPAGTYLNEPIRLLGFRAGNTGPFNDRGWRLDTDPASPTYEQWIVATPGGGCCAGYNNSLLLVGMNGPPAWRMGQSPYTAMGDIGTAFTVPGVTPTPVTAEYWKVSGKDSVVANRNKFLQGGTAPFDPDADGLGGWSGPVNGTETTNGDNVWGLEWLMIYSDAHVPNTATMDNVDCVANFGGSEPRDIASDSTGALGWYGVPVDRAVVQAMAVASDGCKGITMDSISIATYLNPIFYGRDQGDTRNGPYCPYLDLKATYNGDCKLPLDGRVNVFDLQALASAWNTIKGTHPNYNVECDFNLDGKINVFDLQLMAANWNKVVPNE